MTNFNTYNKIYIKSSNSVLKINKNYLYILITFGLYLIIYNLIVSNYSLGLDIIKIISINIIFSLIFQYIISLFNKRKIDYINTISISLINSFLSYRYTVIISLISLIISLIIKNIFKNINLSSVLYGYLFIVIYLYFTNDLTTPLINLKSLNYKGTYDELVKNNGTIFSHIFGNYYLSPIMAIISFIYLFYKKSIKYHIFFSYSLTFILIMLVYGLFKDMNIYFLFFQLVSGNIIFMSVFMLTDYKLTPTISHGEVFYGITLAIICAILRFIIPELSIVISLIIGPIIFTKLIDKISIKLKYDEKYLNRYIYLYIFIIIITIILLYLIY